MLHDFMSGFVAMTSKESAQWKQVVEQTSASQLSCKMTEPGSYIDCGINVRVPADSIKCMMMWWMQLRHTLDTTFGP